MFCVSLYIKFYNQCKTFLKELYNLSVNLLYNICKHSCTGCTGCTNWQGVTILYELYNILYNIVTVWFADGAGGATTSTPSARAGTGRAGVGPLHLGPRAPLLPGPEPNPCVAGGATNTYSVTCATCEPRASTGRELSAAPTPRLGSAGVQ